MERKYSYKITPVAYQDIDNALEYISVKLANPDAAERLFEKIEETIEQIRIRPYTYFDCQMFFVSDLNYRHALIGNYNLFFRVKKEEHRIEVLRFLYSHMDFSKIKIGEAFLEN